MQREQLGLVSISSQAGFAGLGLRYPDQDDAARDLPLFRQLGPHARGLRGQDPRVSLKAIAGALTMDRKTLNFAMAFTAVVAGCLALAPRGLADQEHRSELQARFTFSGSFVPAPMDTNKDGLLAERIAATARGNLLQGGARPQRIGRIRGLSSVVEYGLTSPDDAFTSCFRVNEDFTVEENAYHGPIAHLIRPIRDPILNPTLSPYASEEWTALYQMESGELLISQITDLEICVENTQPVPICHVRQRETILGGTGRFKHATGEVEITAIAPTYTSDAPLLTEEGRIDLSRRPPSFSIGPIYGAGRMNVSVPRGNEVQVPLIGLHAEARVRLRRSAIGMPFLRI